MPDELEAWAIQQANTITSIAVNQQGRVSLNEIRFAAEMGDKEPNRKKQRREIVEPTITNTSEVETDIEDSGAEEEFKIYQERVEALYEELQRWDKAHLEYLVSLNDDQ